MDRSRRTGIAVVVAAVLAGGGVAVAQDVPDPPPAVPSDTVIPADTTDADSGVPPATPADLARSLDELLAELDALEAVVLPDPSAGADTPLESPDDDRRDGDDDDD